MNYAEYPWLNNLSSETAVMAIERAKKAYKTTGAAIFPSILTPQSLEECAQDARAKEAGAFTTNDTHTAYLRPVDPRFPPTSIVNFEMETQVASIAFDELSVDSQLAIFYKDPVLRQLVAKVVGKKEIFLSDDPLGCCSINVFRPGYHHSFHFDESEFSTTLMLQEASMESTGLFQHTKPLRDSSENLAMGPVAQVINEYDPTASDPFPDTLIEKIENETAVPSLHTLDFKPGTLSIFAGSKSLHRVTKVEGSRSRLVGVLTFASKPGFRNSPEVQKLFWGRSTQ